MKHFKLIGHPLGHSISPEIHEKLMGLSGIEGDYGLLELAPSEFAQKVPALAALSGFNVTIPYKRDIVPFLLSVEPRARRCGAVNTVRCENGGMYGYNTDCEGFLRALDGAGIVPRGRVLLCGAGGVARMMACEVLAGGCALTVATPELSEAAGAKADLLKVFPDAVIEAAALSDLSGGFDLILNGTPAGMYPHADTCPVSASVIGQSAAVFDAVYNPIETVLIKTAKAAGAKAAGGLAMLVWQAAAAQEIWTQKTFDKGDIAALIAGMESLIHKRYGGKS